MDDPAAALRLPDTDFGTHRPITDFKREHTLRLYETHRAGLWVLIMLYCGPRPAETRALLWSDVDWDAHTLRIHTAKADYGVRLVHIPVPLYERLRAEKDAAHSPYLVPQPTTATRTQKPACVRCGRCSSVIWTFPWARRHSATRSSLNR